jgi:DNA-binding transcriptional MerR regulator/effector-binding domain-containing protein
MTALTIGQGQRLGSPRRSVRSHARTAIAPGQRSRALSTRIFRLDFDATSNSSLAVKGIGTAMFRIGDFSKIARVSGRLLRYYDTIGLLSPRRIDPATGYRYYAAEQLGRLNKILALKEIGLSLDQVARLLDGKISKDEIRGMFMLKKAELEQSLSEEAMRLRNVESRLQQIEEDGSVADYDVVLKSAPARPFLAYRRTFPAFGDAIAALREAVVHGARRIPERVRDALVVVAHSDFDDENLDLEIGFSLAEDWERTITLPSSVVLALTELSAATEIATLVRSGPNYQSHLGFGALGLWMEANRFDIDGPCREVFLQMPFERPDSDHTVVEIQFPVRRAA